MKTSNIVNCQATERKKSQHGCVRWALREHLTPPCCGFLSFHSFPASSRVSPMTAKNTKDFQNL